MTVVCDLQRRMVEHIAKDRKAESLASFDDRLTPWQRDGIETVSMDMSAP